MDSGLASLNLISNNFLKEFLKEAYGFWTDSRVVQAIGLDARTLSHQHK
jgi:hypothetical protein